MRMPVLGLACLLWMGTSAWGAETWVEVRAPHVVVWSNRSEQEARRVAREFEQIRTALGQFASQMRQESTAEAYVLAVRDESTMKRLLPYFWEQKGGMRPGGVYMSGWEKDYAIVRLDFGERSSQIVHHEYVHKLIRMSFRRLPPWLNEGLAEFYGTAMLQDKEIRVGLPSPRLSVLRQKTWIPLQHVVAAGDDSPYYRKEMYVSMFYAEAWALTHYLIFGQGMGSGKKLNEYATLVESGTDAGEAFRQVFGDPAKIQDAMVPYVNQNMFLGLTIRNPKGIEEGSFVARRVPEGEWMALLGGFYLYSGRGKEAREALEKALAAQPDLALAHENMGLAQFAEGQDGEAAVSFARALELEPGRYLSHYFSTMLTLGKARKPEARQQLRRRLEETLELNPGYAPPYVALSKVLAEQGELERARDLAFRATELEPGRSGYHLNAARILAMMGRVAEAKQIARAVAVQWMQADRSEALDLLDRLSVGDSQSEGQTEKLREARASLSPEAVVARGILQSVSCSESGIRLMVRVGERDLEFRPGESFVSGFADTIWYGRDHFSLCHHLEGNPVVVRYEPATGEFAGTIVAVEVRDEDWERMGDVRVTTP